LLPCRDVPPEQLLLSPCPAPHLLLDLPLVPSAALPGLCPRPGGLLAMLPRVVEEYVAVRGLGPLRVLVRGPPCAGEWPGVWVAG